VHNKQHIYFINLQNKLEPWNCLKFTNNRCACTIYVMQKIWKIIKIFCHDLWNENGENAVRFCVNSLGLWKAYVIKPHAPRRTRLKIGMHRLRLLWLWLKIKMADSSLSTIFVIIKTRFLTKNEHFVTHID